MSTTTVRVPATSANLGPGFDALAMALTSYLDVTFRSDVPAPESSGPLDTTDTSDTDERHLAVRSFRWAGGQGPVSVRAQFPGGRGLGFSGAARVAGIAAATLQRGETMEEARIVALRDGAELEGHADNVGASIHGGIVAVAGTTVVSVPLGFDPTVVAWIPATETSTKKSRSALPETVTLSDAVFNIARSSLMVAAIAAGDTTALRTACDDRLHQDRRFAAVPESRAAYASMLDHGVWCAWLSGSGPSVAALCDARTADAMMALLPANGRAMRCGIDTEGLRLV